MINFLAVITFGTGTHADTVFGLLTFLAWPATLLYPLIYGFTTPWWRSWIGRALMVEAIGVFILLSFSVLFQLFGPGYWGRDVVRITGMCFSVTGFYLVLFALLNVQAEARRLAAEKASLDRKRVRSKP